MTSLKLLDDEAISARSAEMDFEAEASLERCGALKDFWYVACLSSDLGADAPLARTVLGVPLALFRDAQGVARALRDRCLHRNAPLSGGDVVDGCLACPYHGWSYDGDGRCVHVPSLGDKQRGRAIGADGEPGASCEPSAFGSVGSFPVVEQDGLVFVLPGGDLLRARRPPFRVPHYDSAGWRVYFMVTRFPNGVTNLVENFMDVPHTIFVHRGWFRRASKRRVPARVERKDGSVCVTYLQEQDRISGLGRLLNPTGEAMVHTDKFYVPNVTRVDYAFGAKSAFIINSQCTPISAYDTLVFTAISYRLPFDVPGAPVARALEPLVRWYTRKVIEQDVEIMALQSSAMMAAKEPPRFCSTEADLLHADVEAYRAWLLRGGEAPAPEDRCREIELYI